jgi:hypothetical protein
LLEGVKRDNGYTYNEPKANINITAALFLKLRGSPFNSGTGSKIITISSNILNPAPAKMMAPELMHLPCTLISQTALTGIHCKVIANENAKALQAIHIRQILVKRRKRWSGKMRRKRRRIEAFAKFFMIT